MGVKGIINIVHVKNIVAANKIKYYESELKSTELELEYGGKHIGGNGIFWIYDTEFYKKNTVAKRF